MRPSGCAPRHPPGPGRCSRHLSPPQPAKSPPSQRVLEPLPLASSGSGVIAQTQRWPAKLAALTPQALGLRGATHRYDLLRVVPLRAEQRCQGGVTEPWGATACTEPLQGPSNLTGTYNNALRGLSSRKDLQSRWASVLHHPFARLWPRGPNPSPAARQPPEGVHGCV